MKAIKDSVDTASISTLQAEFQIAFRFPVYFDNDLFDPQNLVLRDALIRRPERTQKTIVYVDAGITDCDNTFVQKIRSYFDHHAGHIQLLDVPMIIEGGEKAKRPAVIDSLYEHMIKHALDRHCCVLAIGGGAMLDAVGFACATFHRGIPLIRMPSTVLAQNDAGIGVKNGYNQFHCKNLIGSFAPPRAVINDFMLLDTLQPRDKLAGLAEAVKVAAIRDGSFFRWLEHNTRPLTQFENAATQYAIARCAELHLRQITHGGDPFESGSARPLDYGHWSAHKLETLMHYGIRHGEAVAIGMALDTRYAAETGHIEENEALRLIELLENLGFTLWQDAIDQTSESGEHILLQGLEEFRQHLGGDLCIPLLTDIGTTIDVDHIDTEHMLHAIDWLRSRYN